MTLIDHPNLTLLITPPGGAAIDYTANLAWSGTDNQMMITQNFGRQGDTAVFILVDEYVTTPNFYIQVLSQVQLIDNIVGQTIFAGVVNDPFLDVTGPNRNEWNVQCTDYTFYADNAIVHGNFYGKTVDQIVVSLVQQANCGITAATVSRGGFVHPGPQQASFIQNYATLSTVLRTLSQLAGSSTPFGWYVDENRALHFYDATSAEYSGVTFTTTPTDVGTGSTTEGHFALAQNFSYEWDGTSVRNRILVQGADQTIGHSTPPKGEPTNVWKADGTQKSWPLRYTPTGTPILYVRGIKQSVDVVQAGSTSSANWQVAQNAAGGWFLNALATPSNGSIINIWYDYQVPVVAQANDFKSQAEYTGPNRGIYAEFISDSSLTTVPMALNRAQRERQEYSFAVERITFTTTEEFLGWVRAGQTCTIINKFVPDAPNGYTPGINATFIVISNEVSFADGGYRTMQLTAIRL